MFDWIQEHAGTIVLVLVLLSALFVLYGLTLRRRGRDSRREYREGTTGRPSESGRDPRSEPVRLGEVKNAAPTKKPEPERRPMGGRLFPEAPDSEDERPTERPVGAESPEAGYSIPLGARPSRPQRVEFTVFAPERISVGSLFLIDVWAYLPEQYSQVSKKAHEQGKEGLGGKSGVPVQPGSHLTITLDVEGMTIKDPVDTIDWDGLPANASFTVYAPPESAPGGYSGKALIAAEGLVIAKVAFIVTLAEQPSDKPADGSSKAFYLKTAFASYAGQNREEVLSRVQGMKKVAPDLDVFVDSITLQAGQRWAEQLEEHVPSKDIFYLFWSAPASRSTWVEKEWRLALQRRGLDYISPVPLEPPDRVPPPAELGALHFNDPLLPHIQAARRK